jgi:serine/threonine protein kinase
MSVDPRTLRPRSRVGKYRITGRLTEGGFARLFSALDTIEGVPVALKIPLEYPASREALNLFRAEIRVNARLEHANILPVKNADVIDGMLVVASPLGEESLADRLTRRLSLKKAVHNGGQLLEALAHAHDRGIVHCDVKPENVILFPGDRLRLGDFGLARVALRSFAASGSGTVGYMAPEQAMGRPSPRSDVFSAGLVLYRMFAGRVPTWPFEWPLPGHETLERRITPGLRNLLRRSLRVDERKRFDDAREMLATYKRQVPALRRAMARKITS